MFRIVSHGRCDAVAAMCRLALACAVVASSGCRVAAVGQNSQGVRLYNQGQYHAALQHFNQAVSSDPKNADAYYNMARTYHQLGEATGEKDPLAQAEMLYNQCLDRDDNHTDCYRGLAVLLVETGRSDKAFTLVKNWAVGNPQSAEARVELARLYEEFGDKETAATHLQQALLVDQHNSRAWAALARLREESGEYHQALANYQRSYDLNRMNTGVAHRIAGLNRVVGSGVAVPGAGGTRTVNGGAASTRY